MPPFEIFNFPTVFNIDLKKLERTYEDLMIQNHPDRFMNDIEKTNALKTTIAINEAYAILKDPLQRLASLLKMNNIPIPGADGATVNNPDILMENMALQECLLESTPPHTNLKSEISQKIGALDELINIALQSPDQRLQELYLRYVYLYKFKQRL